MAMNELEALRDTLEYGNNEIRIDADVGARALKPLQRMLDFQGLRHARPGLITFPLP